MTIFGDKKCSVCAEPAIVQHTMSSTQLCLTHALGRLCACGWNAARCPIAGCGDWIAVDTPSDQLLLFDFYQMANPEQYRIH